MELPPAPPLENDGAIPAGDSPGMEWYDIEFAQHRNYLDRWADGAVTEGAYRRAPFGYLANGKRFISDETSGTWTDAEKLAFFGSLARRSRWQPDLIAQDIGSGKTQSQVVQYIQALERERRILKVFQRPRKTHLRSQGWINGLAPAARQVTPARIQWEEAMADKVESRDTGKAAEALRVTARKEQLAALEQVAVTHRKEVAEMENSLDKDFQGMRSRRLEILQRAKTRLDAKAEATRADYAAIVVEKVLRTCDENGLKVLDVLVRETAERTTAKDANARQVTGQEGTTDPDAGSAMNQTPKQTLPPPPPIEPSTRRQQSTITLERERQEEERYAYLSRFPVRRLSERHKAEKQMLAKRIRMREKRRERGVMGAADGEPRVQTSTTGENGVSQIGTTSVDSTDASQAVAAALGGHSNPGGGTTLPSTTANGTTDNAQPENAPSINSPAEKLVTVAASTDVPMAHVPPLDLTSHRTHRRDTLDKHAARIEQEQYEKSRSEYLCRIPLIELTDEQKREKKLLTDRVRSRERYRAKAAAKIGLKVDEQVIQVVDAPAADLRLFILHEKKRKREKMDGNTTGSESVSNETKDERRAKRLERYQSEQEEYERLLARSQFKNLMSEEERQTMLKLGNRIRSRECARAKAATSLTSGLQRAETVESRPGDGEVSSVDGDKKAGHKRKSIPEETHHLTEDPSNAGGNAGESATPPSKGLVKQRKGLSQKTRDKRQAKKLQRYKDEQDEYQRLRTLFRAKTALSTEDSQKMLKLGHRIRAREWARKKAVKALTNGQLPDKSAEAMAANDTGSKASTQDESTQSRGENALQAVDNPTDAVFSQMSKERIEKKPGQLQQIKRDLLRPSATSPASISSEQGGRRGNQYDENGLGKTRFKQELKTYHDAKVVELSAWLDDCDDNFEDEFRLFLRIGAKSVPETLHSFRYAPQLHAFVETRRMDLLDLPEIAKLLSHAKCKQEPRTLDLTQLLASLDSIANLIRGTLKLCVELNNDSRRPESPSTPIDHDTIVVGLSLLGQLPSSRSSEEVRGDNASGTTGEDVLPRIPDAEWVDMVDPSDGLFEEDPLAEGDADAEAEDKRLIEVENQQDVLDTFEDEEYEARLVAAISQPHSVVMGEEALPMLEHDVFDWMMYEHGKGGDWRKLQRKVRQESLPNTWTQEPSQSLVGSGTAAMERRATEEIADMRDSLRQTIYRHDRLRWQRIKRLRDPMYHLGSVKRISTAYKSAAYIDSSDDEGSETEIEEEDELMDLDMPQADGTGIVAEDTTIRTGDGTPEF